MFVGAGVGVCGCVGRVFNAPVESVRLRRWPPPRWLGPGSDLVGTVNTTYSSNTIALPLSSPLTPLSGRSVCLCLRFSLAVFQSLFFYLSLSVCLSVCPSLCLCLCLPVCLSLSVSVSLSVSLSTHTHTHMQSHWLAIVPLDTVQQPLRVFPVRSNAILYRV